jgi:putative ABC transport system permease protein
MHYLRQALRAQLRHPLFTAVAVLTLSLGIAADVAIFSIVHATLLRALPYPQPERIILPWEYSEELRGRLGFDRLPSSPGDYTDFHDRNTSFASFASMRSDRLNLTGSGDPERVAGVRVGPEFFEVLQVLPLAGRTFGRGDTGRLVVIGEGLWRRRFGADPAISGRVISLNGESATILGVMPGWFRFPAVPELPEALGFAPDPAVWSLDILTPEQRRRRGGKSIAMIGRLRDGVSVEAAGVDLAAIAADLAARYPASNTGWTTRMVSLREQLVGRLRPSLLLMLVAVAIVLLIACTNVANLLLVRATTRHRELCVRRALGATRGALVTQLVVESLLVALLAGGLGLLVGWWMLKALLLSPPATLAALTQASITWPVVLWTLALALATGLAFGLLPAWQATSGSMIEGLRDGGRGAVGSRRGRRVRDLLVVLEVAVALLLLIGTALLVQTFVQLTRVKTGFRAEGVLTMEIALPRSAYDGAMAASFYEALLARVTILPGVESAGVTSALPLTGAENLALVTVEGQPRPEPGHEVISDYRVVTPGYFRVMGIPTLDGELLPEHTRADGTRLAVVNETMANTCWPGMSPLGRRIKLAPYDQDAPWYTVIGVVGDTRHTSLETVPRAQVYVHHRHDPYDQMTLVMRTAGPPLAMAPAARAAVALIDPNQPVSRISAMEEIVAASVSARRFQMIIVGGFAVLAAVLSLVGLYAVVSFSVAERLHEMAVRAALGARPGNIVALVLADGLRLAAGGIVIGIAAAFALTGYLATLLYGIAPRDLATFVAVSLLLLAAALLGCLIPARRAMSVDPTTALRAE